MKIKIGVAAGLIVGMLAWWGIIKYNEHSEKLSEESDKIAVACYKNRRSIVNAAELYPGGRICDRGQRGEYHFREQPARQSGFY